VVLLTNYEHQSASSPYRAAHAILRTRRVPKSTRCRRRCARAFFPCVDLTKKA
jgi:hypothetical protein